MKVYRSEKNVVGDAPEYRDDLWRMEHNCFKTWSVRRPATHTSTWLTGTMVRVNSEEIVCRSNLT